MRIGQVARLTGVSPRSIRHYHRLGVVEEPPRTPGGIRSYGISHVVRVLRVRYLAESGVPLRSVARVLDGGEQHDVLGEIGLLRHHLDNRVAALQRQREKLDKIILVRCFAAQKALVSATLEMYLLVFSQSSELKAENEASGRKS